MSFSLWLTKTLSGRPTVGTVLALTLLLGTLLLAGCGDSPVAPVAQPVAAQGSQPEFGWMRTELFFGLTTPDGTVSDEDWEEFVRDFVTPRLEEGFTVLDGYGQWLPPGGSLAKERSKILVFVHRVNGTYGAAIEEVRSEYKRRFKQSSVLRVDVPASAWY
jgi:hypothetical protein